MLLWYCETSRVFISIFSSYAFIFAALVPLHFKLILYMFFDKYWLKSHKLQSIEELENDEEEAHQNVKRKEEITHKLPANPAALFWITVGSGGLHMMISSWSDIMTTPGNCGNHTRTCTNPCTHRDHQFPFYYIIPSFTSVINACKLLVHLPQNCPQSSIYQHLKAPFCLKTKSTPCSHATNEGPFQAGGITSEDSDFAVMCW